MSVLSSKSALLLRRELWEHRALWLAPVVIAVVALVVTMLGGNGGAWNATPQNVVIQGNGPGVALELMGRGVMIMLFVALGGVACITTFAYLLDCLYAERKDRSILFWKSLPVSDAQTVLTKLAIAVLVVPLVTAVVAVLAQPLMLAALNLRFEGLRPMIGLSSVAGGWKVLPVLLGAWFHGVLWYAPVMALLLLASVLAKRAPLMYAVLPPVVIAMMERLLLGSGHAAKFIGERLAPWIRPDWPWQLRRDPFGRVIGLDSPDWSELLQSAPLWLGLAAAAVMVYIVIRLRRYRDDT
jgi:ABC-2 type transport system permease protein